MVAIREWFTVHHVIDLKRTVVIRYRREFVTSAPLTWMPVHAEPLRMRTNVVYFWPWLSEGCTVANEIEYA